MATTFPQQATDHSCCIRCCERIERNCWHRCPFQWCESACPFSSQTHLILLIIGARAFTIMWVAQDELCKCSIVWKHVQETAFFTTLVKLPTFISVEYRRSRTDLHKCSRYSCVVFYLKGHDCERDVIPLTNLTAYALFWQRFFCSVEMRSSHSHNFSPASF